MFQKWCLVPEDDHTPAHKLSLTRNIPLYSALVEEHQDPINSKSFRRPSFFFPDMNPICWRESEVQLSGTPQRNSTEDSNEDAYKH